MTRIISALVATTFLAVIASSALAKDDPALIAAAESYVRHPVSQSTLDSIWSMDNLRSGVVAQLQARGVELKSNQVEQVSRILMEELDRLRPQLETLMVKATIETYSLEEVHAFIEFYNSEIGASAMMKVGKMMMSFNQNAVPLFRQLFERLEARIGEELSK